MSRYLEENCILPVGYNDSLDMFDLLFNMIVWYHQGACAYGAVFKPLQIVML